MNACGDVYGACDVGTGQAHFPAYITYFNKLLKKETKRGKHISIEINIRYLLFLRMEEKSKILFCQ